MTRHRRPARAAAALLAAGAAAVLVSGCGNAGGLEGAGPTPTAVGPVRLWPDLPKPTTTPQDYGESQTERVPGIKVPGGDVHNLDPVAVVQAEVRAHPDQYTGADGLYEETVRQLNQCRSKPKGCPVLKAYFRDLTGDGRDEMILGIKMPEQQLAVRCYMPDKNGTLTRIMSTSDQLIEVELAGRDVILHSVSAGIPGYEYRTAWSWDNHQRAMLPTRDEIIRVEPQHSLNPVPPRPKTPNPTASRR
ncbi:hypothetical protein [Streptomyces sp. CBMA152]|uniref:hypothetical protein n=1 Tax=Streptomyces sp. CBMA152 TaxID=1896312 RepID=UPI001661039D|nr:hypothetical protein [Streptomyces sp. CBMA152]MBD0746941.1 hypothetical protein [Streptomyces sp. CBMA152]MBD0747650.1 hypothetical protein [Streptomyces sp. CBMA152]